ncbi:hypothetical protein WJX73_000777 [Symbiochloris irregularis]|uniref:Uncharacterized protein n=1 Tax=Symbiochloris irregularis TaxID=706552 RepID=A0AAW1NXE7_9CHLO
MLSFATAERVHSKSSSQDPATKFVLSGNFDESVRPESPFADAGEDLHPRPPRLNTFSQANSTDENALSNGEQQLPHIEVATSTSSSGPLILELRKIGKQDRSVAWSVKGRNKNMLLRSTKD